MQNMAARMITGAKMRDHITPILHQLHWLPVHQRIVFKVLVLTFKSLHGMAPYYLQQLLQAYTPQRSLRSANQNLLDVPRMSLQKTIMDTEPSAMAPQYYGTISHSTSALVINCQILSHF